MQNDNSTAQPEATLKLIAPQGDGRSQVDKLLFSCLMDNKPKYIHQTFVLLWTLIDLAGLPGEQIVVQAIEGCDDSVLSALRALGVRIRTVKPFAEGFPNCNKLQQLDSPELQEADVAVLLDTDTAVLQDVSPAASADTIRAKVVAGLNPSIDILKEIFLKAGFDDVPMTAETTFGLGPTLRLNVNGGVYFLPRSSLAALATEWPKRAHWLIDNKDLLPAGAHFALDQVSFALACHALGFDIDLLPMEMNYQIQFKWPAPNPRFVPLILHYHNNMEPSGFLKTTGTRDVDAAVHSVNNVIQRRMQEPETAKLMWDHCGRPAIPVDSGESETNTSRLTSRPARRLETPYGVFFSPDEDMITGQLEEFGAHTRGELAMLLSLIKSGDLVIDIGAHIGTFAIPFATAVGKQGRVIAAEADADTFSLLRQNVAANNLEMQIEVMKCLVSDQAKALRKFADPHNTAATYFKEDGAGSVEPTVSLDALWRKMAGREPVNLVKIDTEGMEVSVLRSGRELITKCRPILYIEVVEKNLQRNGHTPENLEEILAFHDYALFCNQGPRNSASDVFEITALPTLRAGGEFFDCLAVPKEQVAALGLPLSKNI